MIIENIRTSTKKAHQALEGVLIPVLKKMNTADSYAALLNMFYGYYKGVELQLNQHLNDELIPRYSSRRKGELILADLEKLGSNETPVVSDILPVINSTPAAFGAMYVLEGSTLGGQIITRMLMNSLQMPVENFQFYNCYGEDSNAYWGEFIEAINSYAATLPAEQQQQIVDSANETFACFKALAERDIASLIVPAAAEN